MLNLESHSHLFITIIKIQFKIKKNSTNCFKFCDEYID